MAVRKNDGVDVDLTLLESPHGSQRSSLVFSHGVEHHENGWHSRVELRIIVQVVLHAVEREALAVQIGQLLHLETALLSNGLSESLSEEHDAFSKLELLSIMLRELDAVL